jgi:hypothetical protein
MLIFNDFDNFDRARRRIKPCGGDSKTDACLSKITQKMIKLYSTDTEYMITAYREYEFKDFE